jgi:hypothetical protein
MTTALELETKAIKAKLEAIPHYTVQCSHRKCGKKTCWCANVEVNEAHGPYFYLEYRQQGRTEWEYLGAASWRKNPRKAKEFTPAPKGLDQESWPEVWANATRYINLLGQLKKATGQIPSWAALCYKERDNGLARARVGKTVADLRWAS